MVAYCVEHFFWKKEVLTSELLKFVYNLYWWPRVAQTHSSKNSLFCSTKPITYGYSAITYESRVSVILIVTASVQMSSGPFGKCLCICLRKKMSCLKCGD